MKTTLLITNDSSLVKSLKANNDTEQNFLVYGSVEELVDDASVLKNNSIIIFDIEGHDNNLELSKKDIYQLNDLDPTQVLIIVGKAEHLAQILKSNIQPLIYRAFTKPVSANQLLLSFKSAKKLHRSLLKKQKNGADLSAATGRPNTRSTKSLTLYIGIGVAVVLISIVGLFSLFSTPKEIQQFKFVESIPQGSVTQSPDVAIANRINELNEFAKSALLAGRIVSPGGDNALEYYNNILELDPYSSDAYEGKKDIADRLRSTFDDHLEQKRFNQALDAIAALTQLDPLNQKNDLLQPRLEKTINQHISNVKTSGNAVDVSELTKLLSSLSQRSNQFTAASTALKKEQVLVKKIDSSLEQNILIPPAKDNAYTLISNARKANTVSKANISPRLKYLSKKLLALSQSHLNNGELENAQRLIDLLKPLNVNVSDTKALTEKIISAKAAQTARLLAEKNASQATNEQANTDSSFTAPSPQVESTSNTALVDKNIAAKLISKASAQYPSRALKRNIEGWVKLSFYVDAKGETFDVKIIDSEPEKIFDNAALRAIRKWAFSPSRNEATGQAVTSDEFTTKILFQLE